MPLKLQLAVLMFTAVAILLYSTACTRCEPRSLLRDVLTVRGPALSTHLSHSIQLTKFPAISNPASSSSNYNNNRRPSSSSSRSASDGKIHAAEDTTKKKTKKSGDRNLFETHQQQQNNNMTRSSSDIKTAPKKKSQQQQQRSPSQDPAPAKLRQVMKEMECRRILHTWIETLLTCSLESVEISTTQSLRRRKMRMRTRRF